MRNLAVAGALLVCLASPGQARRSISIRRPTSPAARRMPCSPTHAGRWRSRWPNTRRAPAVWRFPTTSAAASLALLVRGGCTLAPDAYLFTVIDRAILAEKDKLPKR